MANITDVDQYLEECRNGTRPFPYIHTYLKVGNAMDRLRVSAAKVEEVPHRIFPVGFGSGRHHHTHSPSSHRHSAMVTYPRGTYFDYEFISGIYTDEARMAARRSDASHSPLECWNQGTSEIRETLEQLISEGLPLTNENVRSRMYDNRVKQCTIFRPSWAIAVYRYFNAKRILDPCAGWGDRLVAAIGHDAERYLGFDPNTALIPGHRGIVEEQGGAQHERFKVVCAPFEDALLGGQKFDLVFTSPPFWDLEIYSDEDTQSTKRYDTYESWRMNFLFPMLAKAWSALERGGHMVIHITDRYNFKVCDWMISECLARLYGCKYSGAIMVPVGSSNGMNGRTGYPMWVFKKDQ